MDRKDIGNIDNASTCTSLCGKKKTIAIEYIIDY